VGLLNQVPPEERATSQCLVKIDEGQKIKIIHTNQQPNFLPINFLPLPAPPYSSAQLQCNWQTLDFH